MKISTIRRIFNPLAPMALGTAVTVTAVLASHSTWAQTASLSDVDQNYWARPFIERLAKEEIIAGFPDGTFKPNQPVTRSQFAAIVRNAFNKGAVRNSRTFSDVAAKYWAASAIDKAYITGFLSGYPDGTFKPEQQIPKVQALVSLASGLQLDAPNDLNKTLEVFRDTSEIPDYARKGVGSATQKILVVNYPNVAFLNPNDVATRADIAAFVYQALVNQGKMSALPSTSKAVAYIVNYK
ncbi:MAG: S-layer homology domain-containing protein, partial [Thermosynechococcaceae cyanobacterium]